MAKHEFVPDNPGVRELAVSFVGEFDLAQELSRDMLFYAEVAKGLSITGNRYNKSRSLGDIALALGVGNNSLKKFLHGKRVLDIGCGTGAFCADIAKDRSVTVTGIDVAANFTPVPGGQDPEFRQLSGYDVNKKFGRDFDVVTSIYSHVYWAKTPQEARQGIRSSLDVTTLGGSAIFIPILSRIEQRKQLMDTHADNPLTLQAIQAVGYVTAAGIDELLQSEARGEIACAFTSSARNNLEGHESYSVVAQLLDT